MDSPALDANEPPAANTPARRLPRWLLILAAVGLIGGLGAFGYLQKTRIRSLFWKDMHDLPLDARGYQIEELPFIFQVSYARGHDVYFADHEGKVFKVDDRDPNGSRQFLGDSGVCPPRMIFVTSSGTIFVSHDVQPPVLRSTDGGKTWEKSLDWAFWRMDEDEKTHTLYAGNYTKKKHEVFRATIFKSADEGKTWEKAWAHPELDHIHSVRYDPLYRRVYFSSGDRPWWRCEQFSDDQGKTWTMINEGRDEGHTDLAITDNRVIWGSDDQWGRILLAPRDPVQIGKEVLFGHYQQIWFVVAGGKQVYAGTLATVRNAGHQAFLLASSDEGTTWQKIVQFSRPDGGEPAFTGESRCLSADGWLYVSQGGSKALRVRKASQ